jgi:hypothetical protein
MYFKVTKKSIYNGIKETLQFSFKWKCQFSGIYQQNVVGFKSKIFITILSFPFHPLLDNEPSLF